MGWFHDDAPKCEGYVVGLERVTEGNAHGSIERWHEIRHPDPRPKVVVQAIQVGCDCGWRSPVMTAPIGTMWYPCIVELPSGGFEDRARLIWREHVEAEKRTPAEWFPSPARKAVR